MLVREQAYKAISIANNSSLVAWVSKVSAAQRVEGQVTADASHALTVTLECLRPQTPSPQLDNGTVATTSSLADGNWTVIEGPLAVAAGTCEPISWKLVTGEVRLLVNNASGGAATPDVEVNTRT